MVLTRGKKHKAKARVASLTRPGKVVRRSVSLDPEVDAMAHKLAGGSDFSSFVNEALRRDIQRTQMLGLLRDLDEKFGPLSEAAKKGAEALWQARSHSTAER